MKEQFCAEQHKTWEKVDIKSKNPIAKQLRMDFCIKLQSRFVFGFEGTKSTLKKIVCQTNEVILDSSAVEHSAVNRRVVGSNPTRGVWLLGQAVKTSPFHGGNRGSIPLGVTIFFLVLVLQGPLAQWSEQAAHNRSVRGSKP